MKRQLPPESTGRVIALAVAFFGGLGLLGYMDGVFERLSAGTLMALAAFAIGFAALAWHLDAPLREALKRAVMKSPARRPSALPAAPSAPRTSAPGSSAARARPAG
jgi:hypothetical protein